MKTLTISIPDDRAEFVEEQCKAGGYTFADAYLDALMHNGQTRAARERIEAFLIEVIESGLGIPVTPEFWDEFEREAKDRLEARRRSV